MVIELVQEQINNIIVLDLRTNYEDIMKSITRDTKLIYAFERLLRYYMPITEANNYIEEIKNASQA